MYGKSLMLDNDISFNQIIEHRDKTESFEKVLFTYKVEMNKL